MLTNAYIKNMKKLLLSLFAGIALISWQNVEAADPVTIAVPDAAAFANWTVIDANASTSANTWTYNDADAVYTEDKTNAADDWLISPAVTLLGGHKYTISSYVKNGSSYSSDSHNIVITAGTAATVEAQTTTIASSTAFKTRYYTNLDGTFTPETDGNYYLAIHEQSKSYQGNMYFQKFVVTDVTPVPLTIPYSETFDAKEDFETFTLLDPLGAGRVWMYNTTNKCAQYWGGTAPVDTWLVTPQLIMEAGKTYKLTFKTGLESATSSKEYKDLYVYLGNEASVDAMTQQLFYENIQSALMEEKTVYFSVPKDGNWNIGFRCYGATTYNAIYVDNIAVVENAKLPGDVTDLTATAGADGAMKVDVAFTLPSADIAGSTLAADDVLGWEIFRGEEKVSEGVDAAPGSAVTYIDNVTDAGKYTYNVKVSLAGSYGNTATATSGWVGYDTPKAPADVTLASVDEHPQISFSPVTAEGANGGLVDVASVRYTVVRDNDGIVIAMDTEETTVIDNTDLPLANYSYTVYAKAGNLQSEAAQSNKMVFGDALQVPFSIDLSTDDATLWTTLDADGNGFGWSYNTSKGYYENTSMKSPKKDYLFTPPFKTIESKLRLTYTVVGYSYRYSDEYKVVFSTATDAETAETAEVIETVEANGVKSAMMVSRTVEFTTLKAGKFYIGFCDVSTDPWGLSIGSVKLEMLEDLSGVQSVEATGGLSYSAQVGALMVGDKAQLTVYSLTGAIVMSDNAESSLSVATLPTGVYVAKAVFADGNVKTLKFAK